MQPSRAFKCQICACICEQHFVSDKMVSFKEGAGVKCFIRVGKPPTISLNIENYSKQNNLPSQFYLCLGTCAPLNSDGIRHSRYKVDVMSAFKCIRRERQKCRSLRSSRPNSFSRAAWTLCERWATETNGHNVVSGTFLKKTEYFWCQTVVSSWIDSTLLRISWMIIIIISVHIFAAFYSNTKRQKASPTMFLAYSRMDKNGMAFHCETNECWQQRWQRISNKIKWEKRMTIFRRAERTKYHFHE